ncbi:MAG TPA: hypothetical protein VKU88_03250 [Acidimicrobiales bacterium]|nr:hypothetical protein [Acidimicrobiales bacterium]
MGSSAARDYGLRRIGAATRWMAVATLAGGGLLSVAVAKALPGRSSPPASSSAGSTAASPSSGQASSASQGASSAPISAPATAPQPVAAQPVVNSGGS